MPAVPGLLDSPYLGIAGRQGLVHRTDASTSETEQHVYNKILKSDGPFDILTLAISLPCTTGFPEDRRVLIALYARHKATNNIIVAIGISFEHVRAIPFAHANRAVGPCRAMATRLHFGGGHY